MSLGFPWTVTQLRTRLLFLAELVFSFFLVSIWPIECCGVCKCVSVCCVWVSPQTNHDLHRLVFKNTNLQSQLSGLPLVVMQLFLSLGCFSLLLLGVSLVTFEHFISNDLNNFYLLKGICIALASAGDVGVGVHTHTRALSSFIMDEDEILGFSLVSALLMDISLRRSLGSIFILFSCALQVNILGRIADNKGNEFTHQKNKKNWISICNCRKLNCKENSQWIFLCKTSCSYVGISQN